MCEGRRQKKKKKKRKKNKKESRKSSRGFWSKGLSRSWKKQFVHPNLNCKIHQVGAVAALIIQAGAIWKMMGSCHIIWHACWIWANIICNVAVINNSIDKKWWIKSYSIMMKFVDYDYRQFIVVSRWKVEGTIIVTVKGLGLITVLTNHCAIITLARYSLVNNC